MAQPVSQLRSLNSKQLGEDSQRAVLCLRIKATIMKEYEQKTSECKSIHADHYINVTPVRASPTGLNVDISQVEHSWQDPEEFHLLVRLHTCNFNIYNVKDFLFYLQRYIVRGCFTINTLPRMVKALRVRSRSDKSSVPGICISPPWLVYRKFSGASGLNKTHSHSVHCEHNNVNMVFFWEQTEGVASHPVWGTSFQAALWMHTADRRYGSSSLLMP